VDALLVGKSAPTDEQVLGAVQMGILLAVTLRRLGREARPQFAWWCTEGADLLDEWLGRRFPAP